MQKNEVCESDGWDSSGDPFNGYTIILIMKGMSRTWNDRQYFWISRDGVINLPSAFATPLENNTPNGAVFHGTNLYLQYKNLGF
jgi:hypothetical protein